METDGKLRQAIKTYIDTFHEVKGLVELITELPIMQQEGLLRYGNNRVLQSWRLTTKDIESLYHKLTHSTLVEDINNGIVEDFPDEETISRRMKHLKFSLNKADIFRIGDIDLAFGDNIPTTKILSEIMDYAEAYDYINTVWGIFREWNLIVDCLNKVVSEIESVFLTPHPDTSTVKKQLIKSDILSRDNIIRAIFKASVERGFMQYGDGVFEWLKSSHLIPFFCEKVCNIFANEEDNENKYAMFNGMIVFNGKALSNIDISQYRKNWYKTPSRKGKIFAPKGYLEIEDFIAEMKDGYVNYID